MDNSRCRMSGFWTGFAQQLCGGDNVLGALRHAQLAVQEQAARDELTKVMEDVARGATLAQALAAHPNLFSRAVVCFVEAGERAGILDRTVMFMLEAMWRCPACGCWA